MIEQFNLLATVEIQLIMQNLDVGDLLHFAGCGRFLYQAASGAFAWKYKPNYTITGDSMVEMDMKIRKFGHLIESNSLAPLGHISLAIKYQTEMNYKVLRAFCESVIKFGSTCIKSVNLSRCINCPDSQQAIISILHQLSCMNSLDLSYNKFNVKFDILLASVLKSNKTITSFNFQGNYTYTYHCDVALLSSYFQSCPNLTSINMSMNGITDKDAGYLAPAIGNMVDVILKYNPIGYDGLVSLSTAIKNSSSLRTIGLLWDDFNLDCGGISILSDAIQHNKSLTSIDLSCNKCINIDNKLGINSLANAIKYNQTITSLNLSDCNIQDSGLAILLGAIKSNPIMKTLILRRCQIGNDSSKSLADIIQQNDTSLTSLDLTGNYLDNQGVWDLFKAIHSKQSRLAILSLDGNYIKKVGFSAIRNAIACNTSSLTSLNLNNGIYKYANIRSLFCALVKNTKLTQICLSGNEIDLVSVKMMCNVIRKNKVLCHLELQRCWICMDGINLILDAVRERKQLKTIYIDLSYNKSLLEDTKRIESLTSVMNKTLRCKIIVSSIHPSLNQWC